MRRIGSSKEVASREMKIKEKTTTSVMLTGKNILSIGRKLLNILRFVSQTIDCGDPNQRPATTLTGKSPYGVWGAAGSIAGSESTTLP
jgi:hypothetical protein